VITVQMTDWMLAKWLLSNPISSRFFVHLRVPLPQTDYVSIFAWPVDIDAQRRI